MRRLVAAAALLAMLTACSEAAPAASGPPPPATARLVSDLGNERPEVSYDGLMVRRRVAVAFHLDRDADAAAVGRQAHAAARGLGWRVRDVPPGVLDAVLLEHLVPEVVLLFPQGATTIDADRVLESRRIAGVDHTHTVQVLVHDLRLSVPTSRPRAVLRAVDLEGVLTDVMGRYGSTVGDDHAAALDVLYTGPLLTDRSVEDAAGSLARAAGLPATAVTVSPRSDRGPGVDMSREPRPAPVPEITHDSGTGEGTH